MERRVFVIDETPYCIWGLNLREQNLAFLNHIDAEYFEYEANRFFEDLETGDRLHAAMAIRMTYSHALETLMALLSAMIQAPSCVVGWMTKYKNIELENFVQKLYEGKPILTRLEPQPFTWERLANTVFAHTKIEPAEKAVRVRKEMTESLARYAAEFNEKAFHHEYNSIKHGLRARSGGFRIAIGQEDVPGVACSPEKMHSIGGSEFGSSYFRLEPPFASSKNNFELIECSRNWNRKHSLNASCT